MKVKGLMSVIGLSIKENVSKTGNKFYQMSIDQDGEAGTRPMTEEAYLSLRDNFKRFTPVNLQVEYNDQYKTCRIIGVNSR